MEQITGFIFAIARQVCNGPMVVALETVQIHQSLVQMVQITDQMLVSVGLVYSGTSLTGVVC
jgi:hypothetical protein